MLPLRPTTSRPTDDQVKAAMQELLAEEPRRQHFGYRRWCAILKRRRNLVVNHKRMVRLLRELGWTQARIRRGKRLKTERPENPTAPNQVWAIDMTKFLVSESCWLHCISVIDLFDRMVVGYCVSLRGRAEEWRQALDNALLSRFPDGVRGHELTLLSDNGCQPTSRTFLDALRTCEITPSFIAIGEPKQNAHIERFFRTLKEEEIWPNIYDTVDEAKRAIADFIHYYNENREHSSLGYMTPAEFSRLTLEKLNQNAA